MSIKRLLSILLLLVLVINLSACAASPDYTSKNIPTPTTTAAPSKNAIKQTPLPKPTVTPTPKDGLKSDGKIHVYLVGKGERVNTPDSSFINYLIYYSSSKHLIICMNGKDYVFANVSSSLWKDLNQLILWELFIVKISEVILLTT